MDFSFPDCVRRSGVLIVIALLMRAALAHADAIGAAQVLRAGGCGGILPAAGPLHRNLSLDAVARDWAAGLALDLAAERGGYRRAQTIGVHVVGSEASLLELMRRSACPTVMERALREVGVHRAGLDSWIVMTRDETPRPGPPRTPAVASRALQLVNDARARGGRCGTRSFAPAPPITLSGALAGVAFGHAADMAEHDYFEHQDLNGQSPADRVRAVGYRERLVGENIAYGPASIEEAVQGWLDSPDHCENIMDPRFVEMGIASAAGRSGRRGLYWVQVFAEPRA